MYVASTACIPLQSSLTGLSSSLIVLMSVGVVVSVAVFPIGLVLLIASCCCCCGNGSGHKCLSQSGCNTHHQIIRVYAQKNIACTVFICSTIMCYIKL